MSRARCRAEELRAEVYNIRSWWQELKHWILGTSNAMSTLMDLLYDIRGEIAVRVSSFRRNRMYTHT